MAKFKIAALKDFPLPLSFLMPNGKEAKIVFTVKHVKSDELTQLFERDASNLEFIKFIASGWDCEDEFNDENIQELCDLFPAVPLMLPQEYMKSLSGIRVKN
ncbi:phage tail assembly chaperone [Gibbsiella quercinecans]|uniref:phage tail assembly chaperone n=1 Tax=Gibbsiella quercinecans TaxID=929813 RepID=UPI002431776C|nr:phage tail assembly chaperone [Gibbsiella quercinecans]